MKKEYFPMMGMGLILFITEVLALFLSGFFQEYDLRAFNQEPSSVMNPIYFVLIIIGFTFLFLLINKFSSEKLIQILIGIAIFFTLNYSFMALIWKINPLKINQLIIISFLLTGAIVVVYFFNRKWYLLNVLGIFIAAGAAAIFGFSLRILPVIILLSALAIYDAIAVYKTKHMLNLAGSAIELKIPVLFVMPWKKNFSMNNQGIENGEKEAFFMGVGDAVMPSILVVSSFIYANSVTTIGAIVGSLIGFSLLSYLVLKGKPQAGLPLLNSASIIGFLIPYLLI